MGLILYIVVNLFNYVQYYTMFLFSFCLVSLHGINVNKCTV